MSYETNPITNRLKIAKGWKNPHFPTQTLNYSREMLLWFKIYVFLKAYFSFQQIRLLACEIRISEKNTKVLYLSVNKNQKEQKKYSRSKWKSKSFLYTLKSPLTKVQTQDSRFLLYQDFKSLKKLSSWTVNSYQKKLISKVWLTKKRYSSWVNTAHLIFQSRNQFKFQQQRYRKQKNRRYSRYNVESLVWKFQEKLDVVHLKQKRSILWINKQRKLFSFFAKIQKEVILIEKILNVLSTYQLNENSVQLRNVLKNLMAQYEKKKQIIFQLKKVYNFSFHSNMKCKQQRNIPVTRLSSVIIQKQKKVKFKLFWINLKKELSALKKQSLFFKNQPHFFLIWKKKLWKSSRFCIPTNLKLRNTILSLYFFYGPRTKNLVQQLFSWNQKNTPVLEAGVKYMIKGFALAQSNITNLSGRYPKGSKPKRTLAKDAAKLISKKNKFLSQLNFKRNKKTSYYNKRKFDFLIKTVWKDKPLNLTKTRIITKNKKLFEWQTLRLIRFHQKTLRLLPHGVKQKVKIKPKGRLKTKKKTSRNSLKKKFQYRLSYRREYKNQLKLFTNWRLKYLIQDFIQKYFAVRLYVKLVWPLAQFKNLKFYRIVFPKKRNHQTKRISFGTKIRTKQKWLRKRYVFLSQVTNHTRIKSTYQRKTKQRILLKKIKKMLSVPKIKILKKRNIDPLVLNRQCKNKKLLKTWNFENIRIRRQKANDNLFNEQNVFPFQKNLMTYKITPDTWISKSPKKNAYLSQKLKMLEVQGQDRLYWASKAKFMSDLITTLTLFAKYLDPQPLADALAKVIGGTKNHVSALKLVENVLRTLNMKRGVGYRIALTGRANGANKSRVLYLKKLNRNRPRQTFSKNVNFAMSQAKATIGTFGIKVWVFY